MKFSRMTSRISICLPRTCSLNAQLIFKPYPGLPWQGGNWGGNVSQVVVSLMLRFFIIFLRIALSSCFIFSLLLCNIQLNITWCLGLGGRLAPEIWSPLTSRSIFWWSMGPIFSNTLCDEGLGVIQNILRDRGYFFCPSAHWMRFNVIIVFARAQAAKKFLENATKQKPRKLPHAADVLTNSDIINRLIDEGMSSLNSERARSRIEMDSRNVILSLRTQLEKLCWKAVTWSQPVL